MGPVLSKRSDATSVGLVKGLMTQASKTAPPACFGVVDVRNVAQAHMEAAFRDASSVSGRYILSSETSYPAIEMADMLREAYPNYPLPTEGSIPVVIHQRSNAKARRELGIDFIHPKKSLKDMAKSMIDFGIVPSNKL
jgi:dihydroflavonol-4-reductase